MIQNSSNKRPLPVTLSVMPTARKACQIVATLIGIRGLPRVCSKVGKDPQ